MITAVNIDDALGTVAFLKDRTPESDTSDTFAHIADCRDCGIYAGGFSGASPWERHPDDEIVHVLDGAAVLSLDREDGIETVDLSAGMLAIVPRDTWHRFDAPDAVTLMTITPQPTDHVPGLTPPSKR